MRLARIGAPNAEIPVAFGTDERWHDVSSVIDDVQPETLMMDWSAHDVTAMPVVDPTRFGAPVASIGKIVCIGLNYADHARETGATPPAEPIVFLKAPDTVVGPNDGVLIPRASLKTDWEIELAVVIGAPARYLESPDDARRVVAGYAISNDVSERAFQLERGGQWDKGKNCETFNPLGPWLVTADEVADPQQLTLRLAVNGVVQQDGSTADMIFGIDYLVWYLSQFMTLYPGDVVNTGTPAGVALGRSDDVFLRSGDVMELEITGLGTQRQLCSSA